MSEITDACPLPVRSHMDDPDIKWRYGAPPDFSKVDKKYQQERTKKHPTGSLEKTVEDLVKTWEMEASHKINPKVGKWIGIE